MGWVYILQETDDGRFYIGSTNNLEHRIKQHKNGHTQTTRNFNNPELVFSQKYPTLADARKIKYKLTHLKRRDYLKKIIFDGSIRMNI